MRQRNVKAGRKYFRPTRVQWARWRAEADVMCKASNIPEHRAPQTPSPHSEPLRDHTKLSHGKILTIAFNTRLSDNLYYLLVFHGFNNTSFAYTVASSGSVSSTYLIRAIVVENSIAEWVSCPVSPSESFLALHSTVFYNIKLMFYIIQQALHKIKIFFKVYIYPSIQYIVYELGTW